MREAEEEVGLAVVLEDLTRLGHRLARSVDGSDNEVQDVFAVRSDLPLDAYALHPDEVDSVVAIDLEAALALFEGSIEEAPGRELHRNAFVASAILVTTADFAAGETGGYAVHALRGLREVVDGRSPDPFDLR